MKWCLFSPLIERERERERERFGVSLYIHTHINAINRSSVLSFARDTNTRTKETLHFKN